jgi:cyclohexanone monooxygenase
MEMATVSALAVSREDAFAMLEKSWHKGELLQIGATFNDVGINRAANEVVCDFMRSKIHEVVKDPETAETLSPRGHAYGTKRPCMDTNYFEVFNMPHVRLVDLRKKPITSITETGIEFDGESIEFDAIVYATGFDAMTGALVNVDITGRNGLTLKKKWENGPLTYLGLTTVGFPNFYMITGPGSPSVLSNMMVSIEQHVDWITDCIAFMGARQLDCIEATREAQDRWVEHVNAVAHTTLYPSAASWYMGANIEGKPRVFMPYIGGVGTYRQECDAIAAAGYDGFRLSAPAARAAAE